MNITKLIANALLVLNFGIVSCDVIFADTVKGVVRDQGMNGPNNGLSGAKVQLRASDGKVATDPVGTNTDGEYQFPVVGKGTYVLVVTKVGYIPRPHTTTKIEVDGDATAKDVLLVQENGSTQYYGVVANNIANQARTSGSPRRALEDEWKYLTAINLPPTSKVQIVRNLDRDMPEARAFLPGFQAYLAAEPGDIKNVQSIFREALKGRAELPGKEQLGSLRIDYGIVADIMGYELKKSSEPTGVKKALTTQFLQKWEGTPAQTQFLANQKANRINL